MLMGLGWPLLTLLMAAGIALDLLLGEARRWHPLIGFGNLAMRIEKALNRDMARRLRGILAWLLAVAPLVALSVFLLDAAGSMLAIALHAILLYFCIGLRSLRDHNLPIADALQRQDLPAARMLTARIVSRDTKQASEADLAKASAESLLENGNDAVFGTLFWFAVAGGPGAVLFRLANTLDAMWGYRSQRFQHFGWAAARIDDALNYLPARLTAISYIVLAPTLQGKRRALHCWLTQAPAWSSPNGGPVMSSGAGALGLVLGGAATYDGEVEQRPPLGSGQVATAADIRRVWRLVLNTALLWLGLAIATAALIHLAAPAAADILVKETPHA
ncbi:adenosylcobinamide-phosphate synthase CbiB [Pseudoduganella violacea]|uniref:Cobalamin biosynthesis protein CobD n=1 Tax=Pseudoduganella violacea TaxID=1715466 RepID=A0A7W5BGF4_9BURK|nr:adenosylcobinamide-phosphate synthase CbiB [Pseudoduganella violacea]MBB3122441.1 adenosylcobinamide-phosphate synthase [Pseudoduganella violacea]